MSIFKKIGNAVSKVTAEVGRVAERAKDDILPVAAGIATGGSSLAFLPLSDEGAIGRATGGLGSTIANLYGSLGPGGAAASTLKAGGTQATDQASVDQGPSIRPVLQQQPSIDQGANNLINSLLGLAFGAADQKKSEVASSPQVGSAAPEVARPQVQGMSPALMLGIGGGLLAIVAILVSGKK